MSINSFLEKLKQRVSPTPVDETGMWYQDKDVVVPSNKITMKGPEGEDDYFDEPIVGTGMQSGKSVVMQPGEDYEFPDDDSVYESKQMQKGALTYTPYSRSQNQYTDSPSPRPVIKPRVGDTVDPNYEKLYTNLVLDAGSLLPKPYGGVVFDVASKLSAAEDDDYNQGLEFVSGKKANSLSVLNDIYKISQAKPYKYQGKKQLGGSINNISPEGNVDFSLGNKNKLAFNVRGSGNIPNFKLNSVSPNLSYNNKGFSADVSPNSFGAGYNNSKVNLNANATMRNNAVESAGIQGSYNVTPNLSLTGNYNINKGEQGTNKNYFAGFRYSKSFQNGGMSIPGVNGTVVANTNAPINSEKLKMQTGAWANWTPNTEKPYLRTSPAGNAGYSDNTKVVTQNTNVSAANRKAAEAGEYARKVGSISQGKVKSNYEKAKEATSFVAQAEQRKGSADPLDHVLDMVNPASLAFAATDLVGNTGSAVSNVAQGNFKEAGSDLLNAGINALQVIPAAKAVKPFGSSLLKGVSKYADDVVQTSKIAGKPALPTYKNVYRAEHANFNTMAKPDDLTGRWALDNPKDAEFYVRNLKTPRGDSYTTSNYFKGEVEPVRIMRDRLPEYKMKQQFAEGMPEEARIMSMGKGKLTDQELASVLGDDAADRMRKGILTEMDYNTMSTAPFMYNTTEGILDANRMNQLRQGENTFLGRGKTSLFPDQKKAVDYLNNQSKGQKSSSLINKYLPFSTYKTGGTLPPIRTSNPRDPRIQRFNDSLYNYNLTRKYPQEGRDFYKEERVNSTHIRPRLAGTVIYPNNIRGQMKPIRWDNYVTGAGYDERIPEYSVARFKKPVQPYVYKKPEVVPEVVETPIAPIEQPVKKIGYSKPIIQQFNYMSNENKAKALQKYGSVGDIPFQGVDINQLKKGGEIDHDDDKDMVNGVASILRRVKDPKNRLQLANQLSKQFNREKVKYDLPSFLAKSKVNK